MVKAETALLQSGLAEAEAILLQAALPAQAIMINLQMFNFDKLAHLTGNIKFLQSFNSFFENFYDSFIQNSSKS